MDERIIEKAESYAKQTGRSFSELVENYLGTLVEENKDLKQVFPKLGKIIGSVKLPDDFGKKKELTTYQKKQQEGKPHYIIMNNVMNKLLRTIYSMVNSKTPDSRDYIYLDPREINKNHNGSKKIVA